MRGLSECGHELVQLRYKLLLDPFRPVLLTQELRQVVSVHLIEQVVEGVTVYKAHHQDVLDVGSSDREVETFLQEVANLKFCQGNSHI